jgi:membrane protein implicated in regulation of membrane protease activity
MIAMQPFELALLAAVILLVLEVFTGTFVFLSFCVGSVAVAAASACTGHFSIGRDALLFATVSTLTIVAMRLVFGRKGDTKRSEQDVNDY